MTDIDAKQFKDAELFLASTALKQDEAGVLNETLQININGLNLTTNLKEIYKNFTFELYKGTDTTDIVGSAIQSTASLLDSNANGFTDFISITDIDPVNNQRLLDDNTSYTVKIIATRNSNVSGILVDGNAKYSNARDNGVDISSSTFFNSATLGRAGEGKGTLDVTTSSSDDKLTIALTNNGGSHNGVDFLPAAIDSVTLTLSVIESSTAGGVRTLQRAKQTYDLDLTERITTNSSDTILQWLTTKHGDGAGGNNLAPKGLIAPTSDSITANEQTFTFEIERDIQAVPIFEGTGFDTGASFKVENDMRIFVSFLITSKDQSITIEKTTDTDIDFTVPETGNAAATVTVNISPDSGEELAAPTHITAAPNPIALMEEQVKVASGLEKRVITVIDSLAIDGDEINEVLIQLSGTTSDGNNDIRYVLLNAAYMNAARVVNGDASANTNRSHYAVTVREPTSDSESVASTSTVAFSRTYIPDGSSNSNTANYTVYTATVTGDTPDDIIFESVFMHRGFSLKWLAWNGTGSYAKGWIDAANPAHAYKIGFGSGFTREMNIPYWDSEEGEQVTIKYATGVLKSGNIGEAGNSPTDILSNSAFNSSSYGTFGGVDEFKKNGGTEARLMLNNVSRAVENALDSGLEVQPLESQVDGNPEAELKLYLRAFPKLGVDANGAVALTNKNRASDTLDKLQIEIAVEDINNPAFQKTITDATLSSLNFYNATAYNTAASDDAKAAMTYGYYYAGNFTAGQVPDYGADATTDATLYDSEGNLSDSVVKVAGDMNKLTFYGTRLTGTDLTNKALLSTGTNYNYQFLSLPKKSSTTGEYNSVGSTSGHLKVKTLKLPGYKTAAGATEVDVDYNGQATLENRYRNALQEFTVIDGGVYDGQAVRVFTQVIISSENKVDASGSVAARDTETIVEVWLSVNHNVASPTSTNNYAGNYPENEVRLIANNLIQFKYEDNAGADTAAFITATADTHPVVTMPITNTKDVSETNVLNLKKTEDASGNSITPGYFGNDAEGNSQSSHSFAKSATIRNFAPLHAFQDQQNNNSHGQQLHPSYLPETGTMLTWDSQIRRDQTSLEGTTDDDLEISVGANVYVQVHVLNKYDTGNTTLGIDLKDAGTLITMPDLDPAALVTVFSTPSNQDITDKKLTLTVTDNTPQLATNGDLIDFTKLEVVVSVTSAAGVVTEYAMTFDKDATNAAAHILTGLESDKQSIDAATKKASYELELQNGVAMPGTSVTRAVGGGDANAYTGNFEIASSETFKFVSARLTNAYGPGEVSNICRRDGSILTSYKMEGIAEFASAFTDNASELNNMLIKADILRKEADTGKIQVSDNRKVIVKLDEHSAVSSYSNIVNSAGAQEELKIKFGEIDNSGNFVNLTVAEIQLRTRAQWNTNAGSGLAYTNAKAIGAELYATITEDEHIGAVNGRVGAEQKLAFKMTLTTTFLNTNSVERTFIHEFTNTIENTLPTITNIVLTNRTRELPTVTDTFPLECTVTIDAFDGSGVQKTFMPAVKELNLNLSAIANNKVVLNTRRVDDGLEATNLVAKAKQEGKDPGQLAVVDLSALPSDNAYRVPAAQVTSITTNTLAATFNVPKTFLGSLLMVEGTLKSTASEGLAGADANIVSGDAKYTNTFVGTITTGVQSDGTTPTLGFENATATVLYDLLKAQSHLALVVGPAEMKSSALSQYSTNVDGEYGKTTSGNLGFNITPNGFTALSALAIDNDSGTEALTFRDEAYVNGATYATRKAFNNKSRNMNFTNVGLSKVVVLQKHGTLTFTIEGVEVVVTLDDDTSASAIAGLGDGAHALKTAADRGQLDLDFVRSCISFMPQGTEAVGIRDTADGAAAIGDITDMNMDATKTLSTDLTDEKLLNLTADATHGTAIIFNKAIDVTVAATNGAIITAFGSYLEPAAVNVEENALGIRLAGVEGTDPTPDSILTLLTTDSQAKSTANFVEIGADGGSTLTNYGKASVTVDPATVSATNLLPDSKTVSAISNNTTA